MRGAQTRTADAPAARDAHRPRRDSARAIAMAASALLTTAATALAFWPTLAPAPVAVAFGGLVVLGLPGYLLASLLWPARPLALERLPLSFVLSLAIWAPPATLLQFLGANWSTFRLLFVSVLWLLTIGAGTALWRARPAVTGIGGGSRVSSYLALGLLCVGVALVVAAGGRDSDDWMYLQITQQFLGSTAFHLFGASEVRYSIRYAFHVWIFLQAFLAQWLGADPVTLARDALPVFLAPLALVAFFVWARTFFASRRTALIALLAQLAICFSFAAGDGWGRGLLERSAQDKYLVWLVVVPVALTLAWRFLQGGRAADWFGYGAAMVAGLWVHPVSLFLVILTLGGFALFNLISRASLPRSRWAALTVASLPALGSPIVIRATTLPAVFTVNTPDVAAYLRVSEGRLLFQPPFYIVDPAVFAHPLILLGLGLLVVFAPRLARDVRAQFLWGSALVPLALLVNPLTARILGEMLTPWQLWRMTWNLPAAFVLAAVLADLPALMRVATARRAVSAAGLLLLAVAAFSLSEVNLTRTLGAFGKGHALAAPVEDILRTLQRELPDTAMVLLPRDITRFAPAYTYKAEVMSNDAQKPEDARGGQIDRFYNRQADPKFLDAFLNFWKIEYAVVPNGSLQDRYLSARPGAELLYRNTELGLYRTSVRAP